MNVRNLGLITFFCLVLIGPAVLFGLQGIANAELPSWLTAEDARLLEGSKGDAPLAEHLSLDAIKEGSFQSTLEQKLTDYVPARAFAIIGNAEWQRQLTSASNLLFQWDCYPTFFGSERICIPELEAVSYVPSRNLENLVDDWTAFANGIRSVAERYPNKNFVLYVIEGYGEASWNPAYELVSYSANPSLCQETMSEALEETDNVSVLTHHYGTGNDFYDDFFTTDHHWNIRGAWNACGQICEELGLAAPLQTPYEELSNVEYTGATARSGLDMLEESVFDSTTTFDFLTMRQLNGSLVNCANHEYFWDLSPLRRRYTFYDSYYDGMGLGTITGGTGDRSCLLVGNSYRGALQRPLACVYKALTTRNDLNPHHYDNEAHLQELIESSTADDVVLVANPSNYVIDQAYFALN